MKFGGTSVQDAEAMSRVINIVKKQWADNPNDLPPVVVVSAMSKVTDRLVETARLTGERQGDAAAQILSDLLTRHLGVAETLVKGDALTALNEQLTADFQALIADVRGWAAQGEVTPAAADVLQAMGELASSRIVAAAFREQGVNSAWVDSRKVLVTDNEHSAALPDMEATAERCEAILGVATRAGQVPVMGGFIGATAQGVTTTLGRGGSDYSAAIFGACLNVGEIQIWTDVDGMLTADPRVVSAPVLVPELSFNEASELAYFGA
ncbi:MAG: aspartate kinase, partial [Vicinamibacterales bacterium]